MKRLIIICAILLNVFSSSAQSLSVNDSLDYYFSNAYSAYDQKNYKEALPYFEKGFSLYKKEYGTQADTAYANQKFSLLLTYKNLGDYTGAISTMKEILQIYSDAFGNTSIKYGQCLDFLADLYSDIKDYDKAIFLKKIYSRILKDNLGENDINYAKSLNELGTIFKELNKYEEFIKYGKEALHILNNNGIYDSRYAILLDNLAYCYHEIGQYNEAIKLYTQELEIQSKLSGESSHEYSKTLNYLGINYYNIGNIKESTKCYLKSVEISKQIYGENSEDYAVSLINLANNYSKNGDYEKAIKLKTEATEILKTVLGENSNKYLISLKNLANEYYNIGNYSEAIKLGTKALELRKQFYGENSIEYSSLLNSLSRYYSNIGNFEKELSYAKQVVEIRKRLLGENHPNYATSLGNLAASYYHNKDFKEALKLETQALKIRKQTLGENHPDYVVSLSNLSTDYSNLKDYDKAIQFGKEALKVGECVFGKNHPVYATILSNYADIYNEQGNYKEAIKLELEVLKIREQRLGKNHPDYANTLIALAENCNRSEDYKNGFKYCNEYLDIAQNYILNSFSDLTTNERLLFWNLYEYHFNSYYPLFVSLVDSPENVSRLYDKSALFAKGLLLGAETEMTKLIQESGDVEALEKYESLRYNRVMLNQLYEQPIDERKMNADSLESLINVQEKELMEKCRVYGDYTKNLRLTWKDVQSHLGEQDLAVEFLSFPWEGYILYNALTLSKKDTAPQLIPLFDESQLKALPDTTTFNCPEMTALLWGKLKEQLKGVKNIYFAATGQLHNIGIEYLPGMEDYNFYRLSSTRELVNRETNDNPQNAVIYGNINYNSDITKNKPVVSNDMPITKGMPDFGKNKTKQTLIALGDAELKSVTATLKSANVPYSVFSEDAATEESFKALSGKKTKLLHIDTHGFYYSEKNEDVNMLKRLGNEKVSAEDKSLNRCGLYFAGASLKLDDDTIPEGIDDGVLTGQEIAQLDLRGLDLVVMSACQTGLGDISQGEGVFGLQRGFKKAGAQSLLMSLWNVDAEATQILMSEFYKQYTSGKTKRAAFQAAQQHLRTVQNGKYNQPKYWAAFILLDAID